MSLVPDVEVEVLDGCRAAVLATDAKVQVRGVLEPRPSSFPFVSIVERRNTTYEPVTDSSGRDNAAFLRYEVNIFTDDKTAKKARAKRIGAAVKQYFSELGFYRTSEDEPPNFSNPDIYRRTLTFEGVLTTNKKLYYR